MFDLMDYQMRKRWKLKLKKQKSQENTFRKAINAAAGRHIPQGTIKTVDADFPSETVKLSQKENKFKKNIQGTPK